MVHSFTVKVKYADGAKATVPGQRIVYNLHVNEQTTE